jgi:hypothetical protein
MLWVDLFMGDQIHPYLVFRIDFNDFRWGCKAFCWSNWLILQKIWSTTYIVLDYNTKILFVIWGANGVPMEYQLSTILIKSR